MHVFPQNLPPKDKEEERQDHKLDAFREIPQHFYHRLLLDTKFCVVFCFRYRRRRLCSPWITEVKLFRQCRRRINTPISSCTKIMNSISRSMHRLLVIKPRPLTRRRSRRPTLARKRQRGSNTTAKGLRSKRPFAESSQHPACLRAFLAACLRTTR